MRQCLDKFLFTAIIHLHDTNAHKKYFKHSVRSSVGHFLQYVLLWLALYTPDKTSHWHTLRIIGSIAGIILEKQQTSRIIDSLDGQRLNKKNLIFCQFYVFASKSRADRSWPAHKSNLSYIPIHLVERNSLIIPEENSKCFQYYLYTKYVVVCIIVRLRKRIFIF